ncbi:hypothetical protein [Formosa sp. S-31]|uniref:hypothetical protein n=1 Tax=Formosa sp. S-31 TaxID=2790949 RepID=UPI003EB8E8A1
MTVTKQTKRTLWSFYDKDNSQHKYILSLCIQYGWVKAHPKTGRRVADLGALDKWLRGTFKTGQSPVKKPLQDMTPIEASKVISALENMVSKSF